MFIPPLLLLEHWVERIVGHPGLLVVLIGRGGSLACWIVLGLGVAIVDGGLYSLGICWLWIPILLMWGELV